MTAAQVLKLPDGCGYKLAPACVQCWLVRESAWLLGPEFYLAARTRADVVRMFLLFIVEAEA